MPAVTKPTSVKTLKTSAKTLNKTAAQRGSVNIVRLASVAEAKANLSSMLREVEEKHVEITVMRRNVPVARITPVEGSSAPRSGFGWMRGSVEELGNVVGPTGEVWDLGDEDDA